MSDAKQKVEKGKLAGLAKEMLGAGKEFADFKPKALELGSTENSARQTWQRLKAKLAGTAKQAPKSAKPRPKPAKGAKPNPSNSTGAVVVEMKKDSDEELAKLIEDGRKYRKLVASL